MSVYWDLICGTASIQDREPIKAAIVEESGARSYINTVFTDKVVAQLQGTISSKLEELRRKSGYNLPDLIVVGDYNKALVFWTDEYLHWRYR